MPLTLERTLIAGNPLRAGLKGTYHSLKWSTGEGRQVCGSDNGEHDERGRTSLLRFLHLTDLHIGDTQSPGRFEFLDRYREMPWAQVMVPATHPHDVFNLHAACCMLETAAACGCAPDSGLPLQFALCSGDSIHSAQANELEWFLSLMQGGRIRPMSAGDSYQGVQSALWPGREFWHPDISGDDFQRYWGFPRYPGLLDHLVDPLPASGLGLPWLSCFGNHDGLATGQCLTTAEFRQLVVGSQKCVDLPAGFVASDHAEDFRLHPEWFLGGPSLFVAPDPQRCSIGRTEYVAAHLLAGGSPQGHGFTETNLAQGTSHYVYDGFPGFRLIVMDTANPCGHYQGSLDQKQFCWLKDRLMEVHSSCFMPDGVEKRLSGQDRLVVICSHHCSQTLTNSYQCGQEDEARILQEELQEVLHQFPNVILWVNGHVHRNRITFHSDPGRRTQGFWEVTTSSLLDWPCQARLMEIFAQGKGSLQIACTMLDHAAPATYPGGSDMWALGALHRELAFNYPYGGYRAGRQGLPTDRNVLLVLPSPRAWDKLQW